MTDAVREKWHLIETAPKDRRIRLWIPSRQEGWREEFGRWNEDGYAKNPRPFWEYSNRISEDRANPPTHWLPASEGPEQ